MPTKYNNNNYNNNQNKTLIKFLNIKIFKFSKKILKLINKLIKMKMKKLRIITFQKKFQ